jgi:outer membrane biosynthesis protein TonB
MPSSSPSRPPSPSLTIRPWRHTDSPLLWSNAIVGSLILHLLILVPIARIWVNESTASATEDLIPVDVIASTDSPPEPLPLSNEVPQNPSKVVAENPIPQPTTSPTSTVIPAPSTPLQTQLTPTSTPSSPTPTPSSPTPTPTPTPSSPSPLPTEEPTTEPSGGESDSPPENSPSSADETASPSTEEPSENLGGDTDSSEDPLPPAADSGSSEVEGDNPLGEIGGSVVYRRSELPAGGCGGTCPDTPAQPQITPGQEFTVAYVSTTQQCSGTSLVVSAIVSENGRLEQIAQVKSLNGQVLDPSDPCSQIASSILNSWSFQAAASGGSPVASFLDIYLDLL